MSMMIFPIGWVPLATGNLTITAAGTAIFAVNPLGYRRILLAVLHQGATPVYGGVAGDDGGATAVEVLPHEDTPYLWGPHDAAAVDQLRLFCAVNTAATVCVLGSTVGEPEEFSA